MKRRQSFDRALAEAIDEGLMILGENVRQVIYHHLKKNYGLRKEDILSKPEVFDAALRSVLGTGTLVVEAMIARKLSSKLDLPLEKRTNWTFPDYVRRARKAERIYGERPSY